MATTPEQFTSQAAPELLEGMREIARKKGRQFQAVLEEAMAGYIESKTREGAPRCHGPLPDQRGASQPPL